MATRFVIRRDVGAGTREDPISVTYWNGRGWSADSAKGYTYRKAAQKIADRQVTWGLVGRGVVSIVERTS